MIKVLMFDLFFLSVFLHVKNHFESNEKSGPMKSENTLGVRSRSKVTVKANN